MRPFDPVKPDDGAPTPNLPAHGRDGFDAGDDWALGCEAAMPYLMCPLDAGPDEQAAG